MRLLLLCSSNTITITMTIAPASTSCFFFEMLGCQFLHVHAPPDAADCPVSLAIVIVVLVVVIIIVVRVRVIVLVIAIAHELEPSRSVLMIQRHCWTGSNTFETLWSFRV